MLGVKGGTNHKPTYDFTIGYPPTEFECLSRIVFFCTFRYSYESTTEYPSHYTQAKLSWLGVAKWLPTISPKFPNRRISISLNSRFVKFNPNPSPDSLSYPNTPYCQPVVFLFDTYTANEWADRLPFMNSAGSRDHIICISALWKIRRNRNSAILTFGKMGVYHAKSSSSDLRCEFSVE